MERVNERVKKILAKQGRGAHWHLYGGVAGYLPNTNWPFATEEEAISAWEGEVTDIEDVIGQGAPEGIEEGAMTEYIMERMDIDRENHYLDWGYEPDNKPNNVYVEECTEEECWEYIDNPELI